LLNNSKYLSPDPPARGSKEKDLRRPAGLSSQLIFGWVVAKPTHLAVTPLELRAEEFRSLVLNEKVLGSLSPFALKTRVRLPYYLYSGWQVFGWWLCSSLPIYSLT
jgi:hypothetical protein